MTLTRQVVFIGEIAALVTESEAFDYLDYPIVRLASEDVPVPYARVFRTGHFCQTLLRLKQPFYKNGTQWS